MGGLLTGDTEWVEQIFPDDVEDNLMDDEYEETYDFDSNIESDSATGMVWNERIFYFMSY